MNLDALRERKQLIEASEKNAVDTFKGIQGHKAEIEHWIAIAMQEETKTEETKVENKSPCISE